MVWESILSSIASSGTVLLHLSFDQTLYFIFWSREREPICHSDVDSTSESLYSAYTKDLNMSSALKSIYRGCIALTRK